MIKMMWRGTPLSGAAIGRKWMAVCAVATMVVAGSAPLMSQTATRANRITQELSANTVSSIKIAGSVHPMARRGADLGMVSAEKPLASLTLNIAPSATQQAELNTLLAAQQDPKSAQYHKWLTQEEFGARFGLTSADLNKITTWLKGQGFTVKSVAPSRNMITFSGTVGQAESAFRTQIHRYELDGETHIANATEVSVPQSMAGMIANVGGLNSFRPKARAVVKSPNPEFTSAASGNHFLTPGDWATIYGVNALYATVTGTGVHVGIVGQTYFPQSDVDNFRAAAGLPATKLNYVCISSANCTGTAGETVAGDIGEANLDVEWAGGIAKDATVDYIYASPADKNQGVYEALIYGITTYKADGAVVPVISLSYGNCETDLIGTTNGETAYRQQIENYLAQAAAQGQTILNSSGDAGATGCDQGSTLATHGNVADWPASSPLVVAVGGTRFSADEGQTYAGPYWSGSNSADTISSALQYIPETSWNDTAADQTADPKATLSSAGGGVSQIYNLPTWQSDYTGANKRYVPDVSFAASPDHDGYLVCTQVFPTGATSPTQTLGSSCVTGFRYSDNGLSAFGGTSAGAPSFAGVVTLLVQKYGKLGNLNPTLYTLASNPASYAAVFHDITTGNNQQPCTTGSTNCTGGLAGYTAGTGYDLVTGLGSLDAGALATAMASTSGGGTAAASYTVTQPVTAYTISAGSTTAIALALASTNYSGTVTFATSISPAGSNLTATATSATLANYGTGTSTLTITTTTSAANHAPVAPWKSGKGGGAILFCAVLLGAPFTVRRKQALAVLLTASAICVAGFSLACGGGGGSSSTQAVVKTARTYTVTVTPTGSGTVSNPTPMVFTVTVP